MDKTGKVRFIGIVDEAGEQEAKIRVFPVFCAGLKGLKMYSHVIVLYWLHLRDREEERKGGHCWSFRENMQ